MNALIVPRKRLENSLVVYVHVKISRRRQRRARDCCCDPAKILLVIERREKIGMPASLATQIRRILSIQESLSFSYLSFLLTISRPPGGIVFSRVPSQSQRILSIEIAQIKPRPGIGEGDLRSRDIHADLRAYSASVKTFDLLTLPPESDDSPRSCSTGGDPLRKISKAVAPRDTKQEGWDLAKL